MKLQKIQAFSKGNSLDKHALSEKRAVSFFVPGLPAPGGSKKGFRNKVTGRISIVETGAHTREWRAIVALSGYETMRGQPLLTGPLRLHATYLMPRTKGDYRGDVLRPTAAVWHTKAPDTLKLTRSTEDALSGVVWVDDSQIVSEHLEKKYTDDGKTGAIIRVETL